MRRIKLLLAVAMAAMIALQAVPAFANDWNDGSRWGDRYDRGDDCIGVRTPSGNCLGLGPDYNYDNYGPYFDGVNPYDGYYNRGDLRDYYGALQDRYYDALYAAQDAFCDEWFC